MDLQCVKAKVLITTPDGASFAMEFDECVVIKVENEIVETPARGNWRQFEKTGLVKVEIQGLRPSIEVIE